ncbi:MAG: carbon-nitrogen hydrolase family protein, partial [Prolixibacteraceae bacterium]|nr:carbon-nitrogen hydrolase family protein [Prolixibacteraceae bacterium]
FGKIGIIICYDRQLPEPARIMALKGAQILFIPAYGSYTDENGWNTVLLRARAYENHFPVVFCNPFQSLLIDSGGNVKALGNAGEIIYYQINTALNNYVGRLKNRRSETYKELTDL